MTKQKPSSTWMSIGPAAKFLGVSRDTLRRWEKRGKIKAVRSPTNRRYYTKKQLRAIMAIGKTNKTTAKKINLGIRLNRKQKAILLGISAFLLTIGLTLTLLQFLN